MLQRLFQGHTPLHKLLQGSTCNSTASPVITLLFCSFLRERGSSHTPKSIMTNNSGFSTGTSTSVHAPSWWLPSGPVTASYENCLFWWTALDLFVFLSRLQLRAGSAFRKAPIQLPASTGWPQFQLAESHLQALLLTWNIRGHTTSPEVLWEEAMTCSPASCYFCIILK